MHQHVYSQDVCRKKRIHDNYILKFNPVQYGLYLTNYTDLFDRSTAKLLQLREYGRRNLEHLIWENPEDVYLDFDVNKDCDKNGNPYYSIEPISDISKDGLWDNPNLNAVIAYSPDGQYIEFIDRHRTDNDLLTIHRIEIIGCRLLSNKLQLIKSSDLVIHPEFQYSLVLHNPDKPHFYSYSLVGRHVLYPDRKVFEFAMDATWLDFF